MTETVLIGLLSGVFGVLIAGIPAYLTQRNAPSKKVSDTASIVDSTGKVVTMYRAEIDRLDTELQESRFEIKALKDEMNRRPTKEELLETIGQLKAQLALHPTREELIQTVDELKAMVLRMEKTIAELRARVAAYQNVTPGPAAGNPGTLTLSGTMSGTVEPITEDPPKDTPK